MSDEIVFDVLCTKVLDALRALGLGKFSIRNYYYEGMWPIIKVYRSEGVIFYSAAFTNEIVNRFHLDHENGLVADRIWAKVRKASILFEEYVQTGKIVWKRVRPDPKISLAPYYHELLRRFCQHEANTRAIGFESLRDEENVCRKFFAYLDASGCHTCQDINLVNVNAFLLFIASQRKSSMDRVCNTLKHLSAYLVSIQNCCDFSAALTTRPAPRKKLRPAFSAKEVHTVVDAAAKNPSLSLRDTAMFAVRAPTKHLVVSVIFRLIYCCGLRPVEARRLRREDVNLFDGTVNILESKGHKDRIVVLSEDMLELCRNYDLRVEKIYPHRKYFFQSPSVRGDGMYSMEWIIPTFRRFLQTAGISGYGEVRPRLYDLRHTFATHRLYQWVKEGKDINACLAYLSGYMGHSNLESTAYYIHLLPTLYTDLPELRLDSSLEMEADLCD